MINVDSGYWFVLTLFGIDGALAQKAWELSYADRLITTLWLLDYLTSAE